MKPIATFFFLLTTTFAFAALVADDPEEIFTKAYTVSQKAGKLEQNNATEDAIKDYREAEKLLKFLREKHPDWKPKIVDYRAGRVAEALKRLAPRAEGKRL
jgi:hypothetical protein